ncbi:MAG TPA: hypothetical protein PK156_27130, partial [Polyangium sp.]|nr:hypothetical protein [Polyangium sp.]
GLGQNFDDCAPLGVPGDDTTYSLALATKARAAWPFAGMDSPCTCTGGGSPLVFIAKRQPVAPYGSTPAPTPAAYTSIRAAAPASAQAARIPSGNDHKRNRGAINRAPESTAVRQAL